MRHAAWRETFDYHLADIVTPYLLLQQEIDLRIGASFTRFQTMLLADSFVTPFGEEDKKLVISYGPCQVWVSLLPEMSIIVYMWVIQIWILFFYSLWGLLGFLGLLWFCILHCEARIDLKKAGFQKVCFLCTGCSFQHLGLWWSGIGKCKHMCLKIFGPSIVITVLRKAMLTSLGRTVLFHFWFIFSL